MKMHIQIYCMEKTKLFHKVDQTLVIRQRYDPDSHSTKLSFLKKLESAIFIYIKYNICETAQNLPTK